MHGRHLGERWLGLDVWTEPGDSELAIGWAYAWDGYHRRVHGITLGVGRRRVAVRLLWLRA